MSTGGRRPSERRRHGGRPGARKDHRPQQFPDRDPKQRGSQGIGDVPLPDIGGPAPELDTDDQQVERHEARRTHRRQAQICGVDDHQCRPEQDRRSEGVQQATEPVRLQCEGQDCAHAEDEHPASDCAGTGAGRHVATPGIRCRQPRRRGRDEGEDPVFESETPGRPSVGAPVRSFMHQGQRRAGETTQSGEDRAAGVGPPRGPPAVREKRGQPREIPQ